MYGLLICKTKSEQDAPSDAPAEEHEGKGSDEKTIGGLLNMRRIWARAGAPENFHQHAQVALRRSRASHFHAMWMLLISGISQKTNSTVQQINPIHRDRSHLCSEQLRPRRHLTGADLCWRLTAHVRHLRLLRGVRGCNIYCGNQQEEGERVGVCGCERGRCL